MHNAILYILIRAILVALIAGIIVSIIGLMRRWNTYQFSDGFFWAAVIMILVGFVSLRGYGQRDVDWPPAHVDPADHAKLWMADTSRGKILMAVFGISGLLLFGLSVLVSRLF